MANTGESNLSKGEDGSNREQALADRSRELGRKTNILEKARVYLSGPMDFVASREHERNTGWRTRMGQFLQQFGATVFDPWNKPRVVGMPHYGKEDEFTLGAVSPRSPNRLTKTTRPDRDDRAPGMGRDAQRARRRVPDDGRRRSLVHSRLGTKRSSGLEHSEVLR